MPKSWMFGLPNFGGKGLQFLTEFYKSGSPSNVAKLGDDRPSNLTERKKEDLNRMAGGQHSWQAAVMSKLTTNLSSPAS